jgi:Clathrin adaptor complex small chain
MVRARAHGPARIRQSKMSLHDSMIGRRVRAFVPFVLHHHGAALLLNFIRRLLYYPVSLGRCANIIIKQYQSINRSKMIRFVLLQNRQGKTRLSKWYTPPKTANGTTTDAEKARIEAEIHRLVTARDKKYTNFSAFWTDGWTDFCH